MQGFYTLIFKAPRPVLDSLNDNIRARSEPEHIRPFVQNWSEHALFNSSETDDFLLSVRRCSAENLELIREIVRQLCRDFPAPETVYFDSAIDAPGQRFYLCSPAESSECAELTVCRADVSFIRRGDNPRLYRAAWLCCHAPRYEGQGMKDYLIDALPDCWDDFSALFTEEIIREAYPDNPNPSISEDSRRNLTEGAFTDALFAMPGYTAVENPDGSFRISKDEWNFPEEYAFLADEAYNDVEFVEPF